MQAAKIWSGYAQVSDLTQAVRRMQLALSASDLQVSDEDLDAFVAWARKHHQHHAISLHDIKLTSKDGKILVPIVQKDGTVQQVVWHKDLFEEVEKRPAFLKNSYLSAEGYRKGDPWAIPPTEGVELELDVWPPMMVKEARKVNTVTFGIWTSGRSTMSNNHFVLETRARNGEFRSAGWYRKEEFGMTSGCMVDNGYIQVPDLSSFLWDAPAYLHRFEFAVSDEQLAEIHQRVIVLRKSGNVPYRTPDLICQQLWEVAIGRKGDFDRSLFPHFARTLYAEKAITWFSLTPSWLSAPVAYVLKKGYEIGQSVTPAFVQRIAGAVAAPFENLVALALGGRHVGEGVDAEPLVTSNSCLHRRMHLVFPTEALKQFVEACESYSTSVMTGEQEPPGSSREEWLQQPLRGRIYPLSVLHEVMPEEIAAGNAVG